MEALQRLHNRGSISTGYDIDNSLKFETDNTEYLMAEGRPQGTQTTWTWSCWLKRTEVNNGAVAQYIFSAGSDGKTGIYFRDDASYPDDRIFIYVDEGNSLKWIGQVNQSFRDTSAWYHIVFAVDSTDGTAADRTKLYINGVQQTITFNATLNQNVSTRVGDGGGKFSIGGKVADTGYGFNGYIAECVLVDGSALTPTSFGEFDEDSNIWKPKDVSSLSLGTAGFHMNFDDSSNVGAVQTGTSQGNFDKYNLTAADQATDTPTNNFCTLNNNSRTNANIRSQEGGSKVTTDGGSGWCSMNATMGAKSGKWYWEAEHMSSDSDNVFWGVAAVNDPYIPHRAGGYYLGNVAGQTSMGLYSYNGQVYNGTWQNGTGHLGNSSNDVLMFALDVDNGYMYFGKNGTWGNSSDPTTTGGTAAATLSTTQTNPWTDFIVPSVSVYQGMKTTFNFGGYTAHTPSSAASDANGYGTFEYAPPSGYYALCTKNLEEFG
jgi:hypothetical protein